MDLVDKEHVALVEISKQRCQVARLFYRGSRGDADIYAQLVGDNARESRFAQSRRTVEQNVVERFMADFRRLNIDAQVLLRLFLTDVLVEVFRAQGIFSLGIVRGDLMRVDDSVFKIKIV